MKSAVLVLSAAFLVSAAAPAHAQLGALGKIKSGADKAANAKKEVDKVRPMTEKEERALGDQTSLALRNRFGVVQDRQVTKYVTLGGSAAAAARARDEWGRCPPHAIGRRAGRKGHEVRDARGQRARRGKRASRTS